MLNICMSEWLLSSGRAIQRLLSTVFASKDCVIKFKGEKKQLRKKESFIVCYIAVRDVHIHKLYFEILAYSFISHSQAINSMSGSLRRKVLISPNSFQLSDIRKVCLPVLSCHETPSEEREKNTVFICFSLFLSSFMADCFFPRFYWTGAVGL